MRHKASPIKVVPFDRKVAWCIGVALREQDQQEALALGFANGTIALSHIARQHPYSFMAMEDGHPIAAWGHGPLSGSLLDQAGGVWCFTARGVERHKKDILRLSRAFIADVQGNYSTLESSVMTSYEASIRWVQWLGFSIKGIQTVNGHDFYRIVRDRVL